MVMVERIYDHVPEIAFFIKDLHGRYAAVNQSLVDRLGVGGGLILGAKNPRGHNRHRSKANSRVHRNPTLGSRDCPLGVVPAIAAIQPAN